MGQLPKTNTEIEDLRKAKTCICQCEANFFDINGDLKILTDPKKRRKISSNQASWAFVTCQCVCENHRRRKYGGSSPNSLRPISYFGSIWELYVLDPKTNVFCRKKIQLHFPMNKRFTVPKQCQQFGWKQPKCPPKFQPKLSAQAQKFRIFEKKLSLDVRCP